MSSQRVGLSHSAALVIEPAPQHLFSILAALSLVGLDVTVAESFKDAKASIAALRPALLMTDVRLQDYNGLHLLLRGRAAWPTLPVIVISETPDPVLQEEAERLGATFLLMPATPVEIAAAVHRTLFEPVASGAAPIRPPFERRSTERRVQAASVMADRRVRDRRREPLDRLAELPSAG